MKPDTVTIPVTLTFDPAAAELAELARHIVTRLTDEGALDEAAEHGHGIMATSAAIEWARERLGNQIPALDLTCPTCGGGWNLKCGRCGASASLPCGTTCDDHQPRRWCPNPNCAEGKASLPEGRTALILADTTGASALYGPGETLEQLARSGELDRATGLEEIDDADVDPRSERGIELALGRQEDHERRELELANPRHLAPWHAAGRPMSTPLARVAAAHGVTIHPTDVAPLLRDRVYAMAVAIDSDVFTEAPALRITRFLASAEHLALIDPPTIAQPIHMGEPGKASEIGATGAPHRAVTTEDGDVYAGLTYPKES